MNGDIYHVTDIQTMQSQVLANTHIVQVVDETGTTDPEQDMLSAFELGIIAGQVLIQSDALEHVCQVGRRVFPSKGTIFVRESVTVGTLLGDPLPAANCISYTKYGDDGRVRNRNRIFVSGLAENWVSQGRIEAARGPNLEAFSGVLIDNFTESVRTYRLMIFNKPDNIFFDADHALFNPIVTHLKSRELQRCPIF